MCTVLFVNVNVNVNVNKQYLSTRKSCNKGYDGCAMRVVFSKLQKFLVWKITLSKLLYIKTIIDIHICLDAILQVCLCK